ncbi:hypothetical protein CBS9595_001859 [Malassezia furfur]|nr:hypothetical protein CBS9595_001859 [Malassezia furfur]
MDEADLPRAPSTAPAETPHTHDPDAPARGAADAASPAPAPTGAAAPVPTDTAPHDGAHGAAGAPNTPIKHEAPPGDVPGAAAPEAVPQNVVAARATASASRSKRRASDPERKRRRLDSELSFSSPGRAFQMDEEAKDAPPTPKDETGGVRHSSRTHRPSRLALESDAYRHLRRASQPPTPTPPDAEQRLERCRALHARLVHDGLDATQKEHDALVRELYHLTKFVTLTSYDPAVAQADTSEVFRQFQQHYDLATKLLESKPLGATRSTRRTAQEQRKALGLAPEPTPSASTSGTRRASAPEPKRRAPERRARAASPPVQTIGLVPLASAKLNTRHPPTLPLMSPAQRPQPPITPRGSLQALFASYTMWDDEVVSPATREQRIAREAQLYRRWDAYRRQGKSLEPSGTLALQKLKPQEAPRAKAHHDHLLDGVVVRARRMHQLHKTRLQLAKKVSRMIAAYWERALHSDERAQKLEEKRQRALAKWTVREVARQWKLAVTVVRAQKQATEKAEREKLGKKQLQAIIEQSTQMLETQHAELSMRQSDDEEEEDDDEEDEEEEEEEEEDGDGADQETQASSVVASEAAPSPGAEAMEEDDAALEQQMWDDDVEDDSEDADLLADAELSLEELKKKYGYGDGLPPPGPLARDSSDEESAEDDEDVEDDDEEDEEDETGTEEDEEAEEDGEDEAEAEDAGEDRSSVTAASPTRPPSVSRSDADDIEAEIAEDIEAYRAENKKAALDDATPLSPASAAAQKDATLPLVRTPFLLRGTLRPYQQRGLEWLVSLYNNNVNGILADEMGLGKTIQTIALLAHLACDRGIWGPHLIVAPTSVMLNWEMEFKKFLPGFKILSYYGTQKQRKAKRVGWNTENSFHVCITSYQLVLADQHIFRRKPWMYLVLDEAHNIKNFRSQRWQTLLGFNTQRRLLLTGTPLQNNLMDLWSLMYFLMPQGIAEVAAASGAFSNMKDFQDWFSQPLGRAAESGESMDEETRATVAKLHTVLRPYVLRRLKSDVEREMPKKFEHVLPCRLSKRQRFLYNDFMSRAKTRESLASGNYMSIINCLMQLRKVCNHPDLFEPRPTVTAFAQSRSVAADYEIKDLLARRRLLQDADEQVNLDLLNLRFTHREPLLTPLATRRYRHLQASNAMAQHPPLAPVPPLSATSAHDLRYALAVSRAHEAAAQDRHRAYLNRLRCDAQPVYGRGVLRMAASWGRSPLLPLDVCGGDTAHYWTRCEPLCAAVQSYAERSAQMADTLTRFAFATPPAVAPDLARAALPGVDEAALAPWQKPAADPLHHAAVQLNVAFPDASLLQYDCGKLQQLDVLMRRLVPNGHRVLIFTQMTKVLDILEKFFNYQGYRYLRLDGATKVEQRQVLTERFNRDTRISAFILSTRSGGLGINLVGADTVLFYDLDWNAAIESQCMDRAHRIGQTRDVHIYRFVSEHTIEENMLRKANQKRRLDSMVIQQGEFTTEHLLRSDWRDMLDDGTSLGGVRVGDEAADLSSSRDIDRAFSAAEDAEDAAAAHAAQEEMQLDQADFAAESVPHADAPRAAAPPDAAEDAEDAEEEEDDPVGSIDDYMLKFVEADWEFFGA